MAGGPQMPVPPVPLAGLGTAFVDRYSGGGFTGAFAALAGSETAFGSMCFGGAFVGTAVVAGTVAFAEFAGGVVGGSLAPPYPAVSSGNVGGGVLSEGPPLIGTGPRDSLGVERPCGCGCTALTQEPVCCECG